MNRNSMLFKKVYGCLLGGMIGDAMGAPAEGMTYGQIQESFGTIDDFEGSGTDDSAIKLILCEAILKNKGYVSADELAEAFLNNKQNYYDYFYIPVKNMFHKIESGLSLPVYAGMGNMHSSSSAMSISPMGLINACNPRRAALETYDVAGLIHGAEATFCRDGACVMAAAVAEAMKIDATVDSVLVASWKYLHAKSSGEMLDCIHSTLELAKSAGTYETFREEFYKTRLRDIISDSRETVPCVLALFMLAKGDTMTAIKYSANFGRDSDTIGTMVGGLCGALNGIESIKPEWVSKVEASYGQVQHSSKDEYVPTVARNPNQKELAEKLVEVLCYKAEEEKKNLETLDALVSLC